MSADNGGAAFPKAGLDPWGQAKEAHTGMTLRDYFAANAPITMADATKTLFDSGTKDEMTVMDVINILSEMRFAYADAMIAERAK